MTLSNEQNQLNKQHNLKSCIYDHMQRIINQDTDAKMMELIATPLQKIDNSKYVIMDSIRPDGKIIKVKKYGVVTHFDRKGRDGIVAKLFDLIPTSKLSDFAKVQILELARYYVLMDQVLIAAKWKNVLFVLKERYGAAYY